MYLCVAKWVGESVMSDVDPAFEKRVRLRIIRPTSDEAKFAQEVAAEVPGIIDVKFDEESIILHYNNNVIDIDELVEFMLQVEIKYSNCFMNRLKVASHSFVDANAKSNARANPGCCTKADEIRKNKEREKSKSK